MSARVLASLIRRGAMSVRELMAAHLDQIDRINPQINAIVAGLDDDQCLRLAEEADRRLAKREPVGPLHGLPVAFKDLEAAVGFPATQGSRIFANVMPTEDSALVARIRAAGAIPIGKTNVPEFGMGSHTYNQVYGTTLNPYDLTKSAGGSSGGAGAAVSAGLLPIADGSDFGGSIRNPASFNNIVGLRPTVGLVPTAPSALPFFGFVVKGPLARSVADAAFLLSVMAGADASDPGCYPSEPASFADTLERDMKGVRIAWCPDLGGLPLDRSVHALVHAQRQTFEALGCEVEDVCPDLSEVDAIFLTLRRWRAWITLGPLLERHRCEMKREAIEEIEAGSKITGGEVGEAMLAHARLMERMRRFQQMYEFIVCAACQVPPFQARITWPTEIDGVKLTEYTDWMRSAYWISATFHPAISVPAGFTPDGLPVGIQIVGRYRDDLGLLQLAYAFEQATGFGLQRPRIAI